MSMYQTRIVRLRGGETLWKGFLPFIPRKGENIKLVKIGSTEVEYESVESITYEVDSNPLIEITVY